MHEKVRNKKYKNYRTYNQNMLFFTVLLYVLCTYHDNKTSAVLISLDGLPVISVTSLVQLTRKIKLDSILRINERTLISSVFLIPCTPRFIDIILSIFPHPFAGFNYIAIPKNPFFIVRNS